MQHGRRRRRAVWLAIVAVIAAGAGCAVQATGALRALELDSVDARFSLRHDTTRPSRVVILGMDADTSVRLDQRPPFPRRWHAQAIDALRRAGARVIAYDVEFTTHTDRRDDNALIRATRRAGNVVLGTTTLLTGGETAVFGGNAGVRFARAKVGFAAFDADRKDVLRRVRARIERATTFPAVAVLRAGATLPAPARTASGAWIDYRGPVPEIPFWRALDGRLPASAIRGKVVVVGDVDPTGPDADRATPLGSRTGPEINAWAIDTLLRGAPLRSLGSGIGYLLIGLLGALVPLAAVGLTGLRWLPVAGLALAAWPVAAQLWFDAGTVAPFVPGAAGLVTGALGTLVTTYATELRVRRRLRAQFGRFVPDAIVDAMVEAADGAHLAGTRREGTVLFADLRGFTTAAERLEAETVMSLLNRYLTEMSDAVLDAGGTVVSYMGDGIMAVFGAPLPQPDHADRALTAARAMLGPRLAAFNAAHGLDQPFAMGIGLASGPVMSGTVGSARRVEYAAVGDTTNTAARLEALTKETGRALHVADSTRTALTRPADDLVDAGEFELRGKQHPLRVWTLS